MSTSDPSPTPRLSRADLAARAQARHRSRLLVATEIASDHDGVVTWKQLIDAGLTRGQIRVELERGALTRLGRHTLSVTGPTPSTRALWWWALWESGKHSVLDGETALIAAGLRGWTPAKIHVTVPYHASVRPLEGVQHHFLRDVDAMTGVGMRRTRPTVAVIRAAQWAWTDRQAATLIAMSVQQRLVTPQALLDRFRSVLYTNRRAWLEVVIADVCNGAQSLGELDFALLCRQRGLPEPSRQEVRELEGGRVYLDVYWEEYAVHVEIQGVQHTESDAVIADALRFNDLGLADGTVTSLQIPVLGLRMCPDKFLAQVEAALARGAERRRTA